MNQASKCSELFHREIYVLSMYYIINQSSKNMTYDYLLCFAIEVSSIITMQYIKYDPECEVNEKTAVPMNVFVYINKMHSSVSIVCNNQVFLNVFSIQSSV